MNAAVSALFVLLITAVILFYKWATKNLNYWKQRKFPHLKSQPVVGNYGSILLGQANIAVLYREFYRQFDNVKYIGFLIGTSPGLLVKDPELIMRIFVKDFRHFYDRGFHVSDKDLLGNNLFFMKNLKWKQLRNKTVPIFSTAKLKAYFEIMDNSTDDLIEYMNETVPQEAVIPTRQIIGSSMTDVMSKVICGLQIHSIRSPNMEHVNMQNTVFAPSFRSQIRNTINFFNPYLAQKIDLFSKECSLYFYNLIWKTVDMRKTENIRRNDLMQILSELYEHEMKLPEEDRVLSKESVVSSIFIMILAGYETSTSTSSLLLHELSYNPSVQDKLRQEILGVFRLSGGKPSFECLNKLKYLDQVISETLRLYPLVNTLFRQCTEDYNIPGTDLVIEKGVYVHIPTLALHTDPAYWKDPESFDPDRFSEDNMHSIIPGTYMPFGDGPRICIGKRFAIMQLKLLLSKILLHYAVSPSHKTKRHYPLTMNSMLSVPEGDCWLKFTKLNNEV